MEKLATTLLNSLSEWAKNNPDTVTSMLRGGGAGALLGAVLPAGSSDKKESSSSRVLRRVRNALVGGALGAGSMGLLGYGLKQFATAVPANDPTPSESIGNAASSGLARLGYGAGALGATGVISGKMRSKARAALVKDLGLEGASMNNLQKLQQAYRNDRNGFLVDVEKYLGGKNRTITKEITDSTGKTITKIITVPGNKKEVVKKLSRMGMHIDSKPVLDFANGSWKHLWLKGNPGAYMKSLLKGNARRGAIGLGLAGLAAAAPSIISSIKGD